MSDSVGNQMAMRILGGVVILVSVIQIGVAGGAYNMTSWHVGSWWAGVAGLFAGICGVLSLNKGIVATGCVISVIAVLLCIAGVIFDGVIYGATNALSTCFDQDSLQYYGNTSPKNVATASSCAYGHSQTCLCITSSGSDTCYLFDLNAADNCGEILTKLPSLLLASLIFVFFLLILTFTYSIFTCMGVCCATPAPMTAQAAVATPIASVPAKPMTSNTV